MTAVEGNASVYQVNPVSRISSEGRAEFSSTWGPDFDILCYWWRHELRQL